MPCLLQQPGGPGQLVVVVALLLLNACRAWVGANTSALAREARRCDVYTLKVHSIPCAAASWVVLLLLGRALGMLMFVLPPDSPLLLVRCWCRQLLLCWC